MTKRQAAYIPSPQNSKRVGYECGVISALKTSYNDKQDTDCRTGLVYEYGHLHNDVHNRYHIERSTRITAVQKHLLARGIEQRCCPVVEENSPYFLDSCDYLRVHSPAYMSRLENLSKCSCQTRLDSEAAQFQSIYFCPNTVREAKQAAISLCMLVSKVVLGELDNGFAVIRPPGHHAESGIAGGYCVINNIAMAASYAKERLGCRKILIVDWDVHHGNGTQAIFFSDPHVLYFSVHRFHSGHYFPFQKYGGPSIVGSGKGIGFTVNVGWNQREMGDVEYLAVWHQVLLPIAEEFQPDLVLVSAGFDAAEECKVTPSCFGKLTDALLTLANGKVVCSLEGGYVRSILCQCVESVIESLLMKNSRQKHNCKQPTAKGCTGDALECIDRSAAQSIRSTIACHKEHWNCFKDNL